MIKRLLVVEDEPKLLRAIAVILRGGGYDVTTARNGAEALVRIAESIPDLIVSDIRMPGMDGYQLARRLRDSPRTSLVPVIFLTAKDAVDDRIEGFRSGVDAYFTKPFEPKELLAVIENILGRVERTQAEMVRLAGATQTEDASPVRDEELTDAEWRVAEAVARGLANKDIAAKLDISIRTVEKHIGHILDKKGFANRVEIARHVFESKTSK